MGLECEEVFIPAGSVELAGFLGLPRSPRGVVLFAHGSGSGRHSTRNKYVAAELRKAGLATLLMDLLTEEESESRANVFDIDLLSQRLRAATHWVRAHDETAGLGVGYFGASTGAAAALTAAADDPAIEAVVSRGGRPDLAMSVLPRVRAPTLLIVGGQDEKVRRLNRGAYRLLTCVKEMTTVLGAGHLFEEPGCLERVAGLARMWFVGYLAGVHAEGSAR